MKWNRTLALLFLIAIGSANPVEARIYSGVTLGTNLTELKTEILPADGSQLGFHVGVFAGRLIDDRLSAEVGLQFSQRGGKGTAGDSLKLGTTFLHKGKVSYAFEYVIFPVSLKYRFQSTNLGVPWIRLGAEFAFLTSAEMTTSESKQSMTEVLKSYDILFTTGLGLQVPISSREGLVELTFSHGLGYIQDYFVRTRDESEVRIKNQSLALSFGILF